MNRRGGAFADCEDLNCVSRHVAVATFKIAKFFSLRVRKGVGRNTMNRVYFWLSSAFIREN